jgi:hypothetical protein
MSKKYEGIHFSELYPRFVAGFQSQQPFALNDEANEEELDRFLECHADSEGVAREIREFLLELVETGRETDPFGPVWEGILKIEADDTFSLVEAFRALFRYAWV